MGMPKQTGAVDPVLAAFLENTFAEVMALAETSDVLRIIPVPPRPHSSYVCEFLVPYLRRLPSGVVEVAPGPVLAGLHFPEDYLRSADPRLPLKVASVLTADFTHPNVWGAAVCLGSAFAPGTSITALLWELYDILTYRNITLDERNAVNPEACRLLREHTHLLARLTARPLVRKKRTIRIRIAGA
jgi:hypothetical protein